MKYQLLTVLLAAAAECATWPLVGEPKTVAPKYNRPNAKRAVFTYGPLLMIAKNKVSTADDRVE
jgi:hypothetical protein